VLVLGVEWEQRDREPEGVPIDEVFRQLAEWARSRGEPVQVRSVYQGATQDAIRCGLLSAFPSDCKGPPTRLATTEAFQDLMLFVSGAVSFNDMLTQARNDKRFNDLFDRIDAGML
jgi:hypothetical protein